MEDYRQRLLFLVSFLSYAICIRAVYGSHTHRQNNDDVMADPHWIQTLGWPGFFGINGKAHIETQKHTNGRDVDFPK